MDCEEQSGWCNRAEARNLFFCEACAGLLIFAPAASLLGKGLIAPATLTVLQQFDTFPMFSAPNFQIPDPNPDPNHVQFVLALKKMLPGCHLICFPAWPPLHVAICAIPSIFQIAHSLLQVPPSPCSIDLTFCMPLCHLSHAIFHAPCSQFPNS